MREGNDAGTHDLVIDATPDGDPPDPGAAANEPAPRRRRAWPGVAAGVLAALGVTIGVLATRDAPAGEEATPTTATTLPLRVQRVEHRPGDCITWDQVDGSRPVRGVTTVPCDEPHLVEITGRVEMSDRFDGDPDEAELDAASDEQCRPVNEAWLGGPLDPGGRYYGAGIQPSVEGWRDGDREVWCALGSRDGTEDDRHTDESGAAYKPFRGRVTAASQFWRYDPGACLVTGRQAPVPCAGDHQFEVVGRVEVPERASVPPLHDVDAWDDLVGEQCRARAMAYLDGESPTLLTVSWLGIRPDSWAAGLRTVFCVVGDSDGTGWETVQGSVRATTS